MNILLVEDDREIAQMLQDFLQSENFAVQTAADGAQALHIFHQAAFDLVLLDLMIPNINGIKVLQVIRQQSTVPVIILSAKDTDSDITLGLGLGADDYITKPFSVTQVLARIKANLRRVQQYNTTAQPAAQSNMLHHSDLTLDLNRYTVFKGEQEIELTAKEFGILKLFMQNPKKAYSKEQIYSIIWEDAYLGDENAVNVHISRLRNKIETDPRNPRYIITIWGIGYKLGDPS